MNNETTQTTTAVQLTKAQAILLRRAIQDSIAALVSSTDAQQVEACLTLDGRGCFTLVLHEGSDAVEVRSDAVEVRIHRGNRRQISALVSAELAHFASTRSVPGGVLARSLPGTKGARST